MQPYRSSGGIEVDQAKELTAAHDGFTGKWTDPETGCTHHLNRWFDPVIGKWLSEDPIRFAGGDSNISRYAANRVTSMVDSTGLTIGAPGEGETLETLQGPGGQEEENGNEVQFNPGVFVVSYFTPFDGRTVNNSKDMAERAVEGISQENVILVEVKTDYNEPRRAIDKIRKELEQDGKKISGWIGIGEGEPGKIYVERRGRNLRGDDADIPGFPIPGEDPAVPIVIDKTYGKNERLNLTLAGESRELKDLIKEKVDEAQKESQKPIRVRLNDFTAKFICSELCFELAKDLDKGVIEKAFFVHVPPSLGRGDPGNEETRDDAFVDAIIEFVRKIHPE